MWFQVILCTSHTLLVMHQLVACQLVTRQLVTHHSWSNSWRLSVLVYNSHDTHNVSGDTSLLVHIDQLPDSKDLTYMTHRLDNMHGNPYAVWLDAGQPVQPSGSVLQAMRDSQVQLSCHQNYYLDNLYFNMYLIYLNCSVQYNVLFK